MNADETAASPDISPGLTAGGPERAERAAGRCVQSMEIASKLKISQNHMCLYTRELKRAHARTHTHTHGFGHEL